MDWLLRRVRYLNVIIAEDNSLLEQADNFLFEQMWKPFGMDETIRNDLKLEGKEISLVAVEKRYIQRTQSK
jgi:hypothetical protein